MGLGARAVTKRNPATPATRRGGGAEQPAAATATRGFGHDLPGVVGRGNGHHFERRLREIFARRRGIQFAQQFPGAVEALQGLADAWVADQQFLDAAAGFGIQFAVEIGHQLLLERRIELVLWFRHSYSSSSSIFFTGRSPSSR